ncbi:MAG: PAS domain-containing protein [Actinobacteria bacterium]|nr:PAS domain-containing protein [Actinomycetota bacterium]
MLDHHAIRRLAELSADRDDFLVSIIEPDDGTVLWVSEPGLRALVGREPQEVIGKPSHTLVARGDVEYWRSTRAEAASGETVVAVREYERPDGRRIRLASTIWRADGNRGPIISLTTRDPSERRR